MQNILIRYLIVFIVGLLSGLFLPALIAGGADTPVTTTNEDPTQMQKRLSVSEDQYHGKIDSIQQINATLRFKINKTQATLNQVKKENKDLEQTVDMLLDTHDNETDTTLKLDNCESLATSIRDLLLLNNTKDSLYDTLSDDLLLQVSIRDSVISLQQCQYDSLKISYSKLIVQQRELINENESQRRSGKRQRKNKTILSSILFAVSGLFVYSVLK